MQAGIARYGRTTLAALSAALMVVSMMFVLASPAEADHIPETGQVPDNCLKFEGADLGTDGLTGTIDGVDVTFSNWVEKPDEQGEYISVDITVAGLQAGQTLDWQLKTGSGADEGAISADGTYTAEVSDSAISHITICLFEDTTTTTTTAPTTTTTAPTTTTTAPEPGEIIVEKVVTGDGSQEFEFTFNTTGFTLGDNTLAHGQSSSSGEIAAGDGYAVSEDVPAGWILVSATCDDGSPITDIDVSEGEIVTCTFTNTIEDTVGAAIFVTVDGSCQIVDGQGQGVIDVIISVDGGATVTISDTDGVIDTFTSDASLNVDAGASYTWEATANTGFEFPPGFEASGTIEIEDCTPPPPPPDQGEIIVQKVVQGDGNRDFEFTFQTEGFSLGDNTLAHGQNSSSGPLAPGTGYSVEEVLPGGWEQLSATCDDGSSPSNIDLSAGEQVTCTFVNTVPALVGASIEVTVTGRCELEGSVGTGFIDVVISVDDGATVVVRNSAGTVVGTLTEDGTITVAEGATYTWEATPAEGFEFPAGAVSSGTITIESCSDLDELPFTGLDLNTMAALAAALLGAGLLVLGTQLPRREQ